MPTRARWVCLLVLMIPALAPVATRGQDDAESVFSAVYGDRLKQVLASASTTDDAELARELLEAARTNGTTPRLQLLLCTRAAELGAKDPAGYESAISAMHMRAKLEPDRRAELAESVAALRQRQHKFAKADDKIAAGEVWIEALMDAAEAKADQLDDYVAALRKASSTATALKSPRAESIRAALDTAASRQRTLGRITDLKEKLKSNPDDKAAGRELVRLCVVALDDPAEARKFAFLSDDADFNRRVIAASGEAAALDEAAVLDLGDWYRALSDEEPDAKLPMLARAQSYYMRYLDVHSTGDLTRTKVTLLVKSIGQTLDAARVQPRQVPQAHAGVKATIQWLMADDMDIYHNGKPLREYNPSFKTRPDEARQTKPYSASIVLRHGDVFTIGGRRGGSYGGTVIVVDENNKLIWCSNLQDWRVYEPVDPEKWYLPDVAGRSKQTPVYAAQSFGHQETMRRNYDNLPQPIWADASQRFAYMVGVYRSGTR